MRVKLNHPPRDCQICGGMPVARHEVFYGTANRKQSIKWGFFAWLCPLDHNMDLRGVHFNKDLDNQLKRQYQAEAEAAGWTRSEFIQTFGRSYL